MKRREGWGNGRPNQHRVECAGDEADIHLAVTRAFGSDDEANLVRMLRDRQPGFQRELSICARDGSELVGYLALLPVLNDGCRFATQQIHPSITGPVASPGPQPPGGWHACACER